MPYLLLAFAVGVLVCQWLPVIPPLLWGWFLTLAVLATLFLLHHFRTNTHWPSRWLLPLVLIGGFVSGVSYTCWRSAAALADQLPEAAMGRNIKVTGIVDSLPDRTARGQRFLFRVESAEGSWHIPELIQLSVWQKDADGEVLNNDIPQSIQPGERWQFTVRLKRPHGLANPHGYDLEARLFEMGVRATGYIRGGAILDPYVVTPATLIARMRYQIRARFERVLPQEMYPDSGILTALAIGDQRAIPGGMWQVFAKTGTTHLMSI